MYIDDSRVIFFISKLTNFHKKPLEFLAYPSEKAICVVRIIKLYLDKTANMRDKNMYFFFINYVALYAPVTTKTITRWIVETLGKAGINTKSFKVHATCSASTSAAYNKVPSLCYSLKKDLRMRGQSHMNTYQGGGTSREK